MNTTYKFTLVIEGVGKDFIEAWRDAVEAFAFDPGAAISGEVVYCQSGSDKVDALTVDSLIMRQEDE